MGPIAYFGETEMLQKGTREFTLKSRWDWSLISVRPECYEGKQRDYNPISVRPICLGFVVVAMTFETRWRRIGRIGGAEFDFWFGTYVDMRKWLRVFGAYH